MRGQQTCPLTIVRGLPSGFSSKMGEALGMKFVELSMAWEETHVMTKIMTATLVVTYIPALVPSMFALNVGKRSTLITSEVKIKVV